MTRYERTVAPRASRATSAANRARTFARGAPVRCVNALTARSCRVASSPGSNSELIRASSMMDCRNSSRRLSLAQPIRPCGRDPRRMLGVQPPSVGALPNSRHFSNPERRSLAFRRADNRDDRIHRRITAPRHRILSGEEMRATSPRICVASGRKHATCTSRAESRWCGSERRRLAVSRNVAGYAEQRG